MTIDEAIENLKYDIEIDMYIRDIAPQIAEWLEELKALREKNETLKALYEYARKEGNDLFKHERNKAIDDFYNALAYDLIWIKERFGDDVYTDLWCDVGTRAEQLKVGGNNGTDNQ